MRGKTLKIIFSIVIWCGMVSSAQAERNLALLFENGGFFEESPDQTVLTFPLFCEGNVLCGSEVDTIVDILRFDEERIEVLLDVQVCQCPSCPDPISDPLCQTCISPSCVTARNALFVEDAIPQIPQPDGTTFAATMTQHDPIACADVSGIFAEAGCAGTLDLDYRCMNVFDIPSAMFIRAFAGTYIISTTGN